MSDKPQLTMRDVSEAFGGLQALVERYKKDLPVAASLRLGRLIRQLRAEAQLLTEQRNALVIKHGETITEKDKDGKAKPARIQVPPGTRAEVDFLADEAELLRQPSNIHPEPFNLADLGLERIDADIIVAIMPVLAEGE